MSLGRPSTKSQTCCSVCGRPFRSSWDLRRHMRTHTGEKPYACTFCPYRAAQQEHIATHMRRHTKISDTLKTNM